MPTALPRPALLQSKIVYKAVESCYMTESVSPSRFAPSMQPTEEDEVALTNARSLLDFIQGQPGSGLPTSAENLEQLRRLSSELQPLLPDLLPGVAVTGVLLSDLSRQQMRKGLQISLCASSMARTHVVTQADKAGGTAQ